jgi:histidine ammonia-lyase
LEDLMRDTIVLETALTAEEITAVAVGALLELGGTAQDRIVAARAIVEALVDQGIRGYGINTGVGALCDVIIDRKEQSALSRNLLYSHACGVGEPLDRIETRAIMAAQINNFAHGYSGIRLDVVEALLTLLNNDMLPLIPSRGSVGYLTHAAAIGLVLIGAGECQHGDMIISGSEALRTLGLKPLVLQAKEGLSLVNGTPCATGLSALAVTRLAHLLDWADAAAAMSYENLGAQSDPFAEMPLALRKSPGLQIVGHNLRRLLAGSPLLAEAAGKRTQDPLSLRAVPHVHGAVRDALVQARKVVDQELASVTDNPAVSGSPTDPQVHSQAHAVGAAIGLAMDHLATAAAELAAISERRIDRLVNPLVSGLPAFLASGSGVESGFMIIQYTAVALVAENRRLAMPASLDGGITSALQEDILTHATPAAAKALAILDNLETVLAIELTAAAQAHDLQSSKAGKAAMTEGLYQRVRHAVPFYRDDRPMNGDIHQIRTLLKTTVAWSESEVA